MQTYRQKRATVRLPEYALSAIKEEAKKHKRSVSSMMAMYILDGLYHEPNETTLAAMAECESDVELDELTAYDIEHLDEYIDKL